MVPGEEVFIKVDQTLTHDINAVMTYLAFEAIGLDRIRTECSVSYLDHNLLYVDNKTPDDHIYLQSAAKKFGVHVSRPGNGICHTVHVARFGAPGKISMGGDSHTPHGGSIGMLCIGVGGMDVATAMTGVPMRLKMPRVIQVYLTGELNVDKVITFGSIEGKYDVYVKDADQDIMVKRLKKIYEPVSL